jgi:chemosensory pili system protein ChpC
VSQQRPSELYALLAPLDSERLLVPRGCVAEVIAYQAPQTVADAPPWHLGMINWNGRKVPLVSFEGAAGGAVSAPTARSRIVILNVASLSQAGGYLAVLSQGFPQLLRVTPEIVKLDASRQFPEDSPVICRLHMLNDSPLVPDLERLGQMVSKAMGAARAE